MTRETNITPAETASARPHRRTIAAAAVLAMLGLGAGATAYAQRSSATVAALPPAPITAMKDRTAVAVKGEVAEVFGNKFIVQDDGGRALVETGPRGESGKLVTKSETVTVQGRFEHGFIHATAIGHADGRTELVGPPGPPPPMPAATATDAGKG